VRHDGPDFCVLQPEIATITGHSLKDVEAILDAHYLGMTTKFAPSLGRQAGARRHGDEHALISNAGQRERQLETAMFVVVGADRTFIRNGRLPDIGSRGAG